MNFFRNRFIVVVVTLLLALMPLPLFAQPGPPPIPLTPSGDLNDWTLVAPPWKSIEDDPALNFTNLATAPSWGYQGTCLSIDTNVPAFLQLPVYEDDWTNIDLTNGSLEIWCQANWTSMADSGSGPDSWATVFDIGNYRHDASIGAWLLAIDPPGSNLVWVAQSGGSNQVLSTPIDFNAGDWHQIVTTWSETNNTSCIYIDGELATNAGAMVFGPSAAVMASDGFCVGSISASGTNAGTHQFAGQLQIFSFLFLRVKPR